MATKNQITGGGFQNAIGALLANGYILFELSQDAQVNGTTQITAGFTVQVDLDSSGNVITSPAQQVWPNDVLSPGGTFYNVSVYSATGQLVWGPNAQQVLSSPSPFVIGAWVPAAVNVGLGTTSGTVTSVSVATANGVSGTVANPTGPAVITLSLAGFLSQNNTWTGGNQFNGTTTFDGAVTVAGSLFQSDGNVVVIGEVILENATPATSGANHSCPSEAFNGEYWTGSATAQDQWTIQPILAASGANPTSTLTIAHSGSSGVAKVAAPDLELTNATTATTATAGSATLPANPLGFWDTVINGTAVKIPYYRV